METLVPRLDGEVCLGKFGAAAVEFMALLLFPLAAFGEDVLPGGEEDSASVGLMERIEVNEGFLRNGASNPEGIVSSFALRSRRVVSVEV